MVMFFVDGPLELEPSKLEKASPLLAVTVFAAALGKAGASGVDACGVVVEL